MTSVEFVRCLLQINLELAVAVLAVLVLRLPLRALFGARAAYGFWLLVPAAMLASQAPGPAGAPQLGPLPAGITNAPVQAVERLTAQAAEPSSAAIFVALWLAGVLASLVWLLLRQRRFSVAARRGRAGPAVAGFLSPRLVLPSDFDQRFNSAEQAVVLAHEAIHLRRQDARINGVVAFIQCAFWFNPLLHLGAHLMRVDQELACDAVITEHHPQARGDYAQAMLKAQLTPADLPLGCFWPAGGRHPLTRRIALLKRPAPRLGRRAAAYVTLTAMIAASGLTAWSFAPAAAQSPAIAVSMPSPAQAPPPGPNLALLNIQPDGLYIRNIKTTLPNLIDDLRAHSNAKKAGDPVMLRADRSVPYSQVMPVLNKLGAAGFAINIIAEDF